MKLNTATQGFSFPIFCDQCNYLICGIYNRKFLKIELLFFWLTHSQMSSCTYKQTGFDKSSQLFSCPTSLSVKPAFAYAKNTETYLRKYRVLYTFL
jgi:hypothetical protein